MIRIPLKTIIAFDSNTSRSRDLIPFLVENKDRFRILVPLIVYAELGYFFIVKGDGFEKLDEELQAYDGEVLILTKEHMRSAMILANENRVSMPFRDHSRDYFIASQCINCVDVFITYNLRHFEAMNLKKITFMTPEDFIINYF